VKCLAAEGHPQIDRVILGSSVDVSATPAAYVVTAGYDPLQDEGRDYALRLKAAGVPVQHVHYPDLLHDFYVMGDVSPAVEPAAREAAEAMKAAFA
jgi:acetyl esterase